MIELEKVSFAYGRDTLIDVPALEEVSLSVEPGASLGIVGASGSGKTTLLQVMNGLLLPTRGTVRVEGEDLVRSPAARRTVCFRIGLVFQFPERQLFGGTVSEDVAYGPKNMKIGAAEIEDRVCEALERVGLDPARIGGRSPLSLSFGEMRRVALAGVLAMKPRILLLDEPTAGLDPRGKKQLEGLLESLRARGTGVVVASHDMAFLSEQVRDVLVLDSGRAVARGPAREVLTDMVRLGAAGVGTPFAAELLAVLSERGWALRPRSLALKDIADALVAASP